MADPLVQVHDRLSDEEPSAADVIDAVRQLVARNITLTGMVTSLQREVADLRKELRRGVA